MDSPSRFETQATAASKTTLSSQETSSDWRTSFASAAGKVAKPTFFDAEASAATPFFKLLLLVPPADNDDNDDDVGSLLFFISEEEEEEQDDAAAMEAAAIEVCCPTTFSLSAARRRAAGRWLLVWDTERDRIRSGERGSSRRSVGSQATTASRAAERKDSWPKASAAEKSRQQFRSFKPRFSTAAHCSTRPVTWKRTATPSKSSTRPDGTPDRAP
mmetsp:Transcript_37046/g.118786  ORF Transcript_37046/g.118786 Transcript_37046/m.118786 type:complete len:216 (-) Transcript_37046:409-1056(-)